MRGLNMKTKDKILIEALSLFSVSGFSGVSVRDIAKAVGIRESAIYKHYKNKQDIFDCIVERMYQIDNKRAKEYQVPESRKRDRRIREEKK